jgi:hypothetical protein
MDIEKCRDFNCWFLMGGKSVWFGQGIAIRVASPKLVMEEAPESYKDVCQVRIGIHFTALQLTSAVKCLYALIMRCTHAGCRDMSFSRNIE